MDVNLGRMLSDGQLDDRLSNIQVIFKCQKRVRMSYDEEK